MTDATVGSRLRDRDPDAWTELYAANEGRVYGFAYRLTGNRHDAADLTQETFVRVLTRLERIDVERDLGPYLLATTKNLFLSSLERGKRSTPVAEAPEPDKPAPLEEDPERAALLRRQREEVHAATSELPERQRLVLALCELEQMSYAQIGDIVDLKENAVAQAIFRARQSLRSRLRLAQVDQSRMPAACRERLPLLSAHLDGQLKGERLEQMLEHLERCEHCRAALEDMREASRRYRALLPPIVVLPALRDQVDGAVAASGFWQSPSPAQAPPAGAARGLARVLRGSAPAAAVAAALVLGVGAVAGGAVWLLNGGGGGDTADAPARASGTGGGASGGTRGVSGPERRAQAITAAGGNWEKLSRAGHDASWPSVAVSGAHVIAAWEYPLSGSRASIEAATFSSSPDDAVSGASLAPVVTNWRSPGDPSLLPGPDGRVRILFGGLHSTDTSDPLNATVIAERRDDGSFGEPERVSSSVYHAWGGVALTDGTPVFGEGVNAIYVRHGLDPDREPAYLGDGYYPSFGVDGSGALWVAWFDGDDALRVRRLDQDSGAGIGRTYRAPHFDTYDIRFREYVRLVCRHDQAGCRVVYAGKGGRYDGRLLSWAPGEPTATVIAAPAELGDFDAAYRSDGRLWAAWYDEGSSERGARQGHYVTLADDRGAGGRRVFASQPRREIAASGSLEIEPAGQGLVLAAGLELTLGSEQAIWIRHVRAP